MKIGIDARCLEEEKISGVGEYALELLKKMLETDQKNDYVVFSNSYKQVSRNFSFLEKYPNAELKRFRYPNKILNFLFWYLKWPKIDKLIGGVDVFFAPNINFLPLSKNCPLVITFHDLSFERNARFFPLKTRLWHKYFVNPRVIAKKAHKIIAVSESTKKDLEEIYEINPEKISVTPHGVSGDFRLIDRNDPKLVEVQKKYGLSYKFALYLGNVEPRKNISSIVSAMEKFKLVLAGNVSPLCHDATDKENVITCNYVEKEDRPYIYNLASLFLYPSFFEGFGLPVLEAMASGTPVIASSNSSIPEVAGNAAVLIDPNRPSELAEAMKNILADEKLYHEIKERGLAQSKKFSWRKCAKKTQNICESALMPAFSGQ